MSTIEASRFKRIMSKIIIIVIACLYFGLLIFTEYSEISQEGVKESFIRLAVVVTLFAVFSYIMFFYSKNKMKKRHVLESTEQQFEITKTRIVFERITAVLMLLLGVIFMILLVLR